MQKDQPNNPDVSDLDQHFLQTSLWPAVLYTIILMLAGTVGNTLVLVVYRRHFQRNVTRMFIYALAILDLANCLITMPSELIILIRFSTFPSPVWCKISRYLTYIFNGTSSFVLIAIALDRYFKVCRPLKSFITIRRAKIICVGSFFLTTVLAIPALIIYGEIELPILFTENGVSILQLGGNYTNFRAISKNNDQELVNGENTDKNDNLALNGLSGNIVYGHFCLLNTDNIDGTVPLLFYISMFGLYILMVFFVVFFYGKVAKTMFTLTTKHSKMFSFYTHKSCTPTPNSFAPEGSSVQFNKLSFGVEGKAEILENQQTKDNSPKDNNKAEEKRQTTLSKHANNLETSQFMQPGKVVETGNDVKKECSSNEGSAGVSRPCPENVSSKETLTTDLDQKSPDSRSCVNITQSEQDFSKLTDSQGKLLLHNKSLSRKADSENEIRPKSMNETEIKKIQTSKIPKIKVRKSSTADDDADSVTYGSQLHLDTSHDALSTNSLLRRRIKSAGSLSQLSALKMLQVPENRVRVPKLPNFTDTNISRSGMKLSSRRENPAGLGHVATSCINLDYKAEVTDPAKNPEKTLTLTKTSLNGRKKLCVLPLTGMSTKTAYQTEDHQKKQSILSTSNRSLDISNQNYKSDSRLEMGKGCHNERQMKTRSIPEDLNSPKLDSDVTLRNQKPDTNKSLPVYDAKKTENSPIKQSRKEIISTADILQENHKQGSLHPFRTSRMLFVISLIFVISFLPFFVIALVRSCIGSSFMTLNETELGVLSVFIRSSLINNAANPITYGFLSTHFRRECTGIMCCVFRRK